MPKSCPMACGAPPASNLVRGRRLRGSCLLGAAAAVFAAKIAVSFATTRASLLRFSAIAANNKDVSRPRIAGPRVAAFSLVDYFSPDRRVLFPGGRRQINSGLRRDVARSARGGEEIASTSRWFALSDEQRSVVEAPIGGAYRVFAGPGSGKTSTLISRVAELIEHGTEPGSILCITFTRLAADEFKKRLEARVGIENAKQVNAMTFHGLANDMLRRFGPVQRRIGNSSNVSVATKGFTIRDSDESVALVKKAIPRLRHSTANAKDFLEVLAIMKDRTPATLSLSGEELMHVAEQHVQLVGSEFFRKPAVRKRFGEWVDAYHAALAEAGAVDFSGLIEAAAELLRQASDDRYRSWRHILIDEMQDTNVQLYDFLNNLVPSASEGAGEDVASAQTSSLFFVGDVDQSIYTWRGAYPDIFHTQIAQDNPSLITKTLSTNYRSCTKVVDAANTLLSSPYFGRWTSNIRLKGVRKEAGSLEVLLANGVAAEALAVAERIEEMKNNCAGSIAVLLRTRAQAVPIEAALFSRGVDYKLCIGTKFRYRREVSHVLGFLALIIDPNDGDILKRMLNVPPRGLGEGARLALVQLGEAFGGNTTEADALARGFWEACRSTKDPGELSLKPQQLESVVLLGNLIEKWRRAAQAGKALPDLLDMVLEDTKYMAFLEALCERDARERESHIFQVLAQEEEEGEKRLKRLEHVDLLRKMLEAEENRGTTLEGFLRLEQFLRRTSARESRERRPLQETVTLGTMHSAKGLEFDQVFVVGAVEGVCPHKRSVTQEGLAEEGRLFYVAVTRARNGLYISVPLEPRSNPSRYVETIWRSFVGDAEPFPKLHGKEPFAWMSV